MSIFRSASRFISGTFDQATATVGTVGKGLDIANHYVEENHKRITKTTTTAAQLAVARFNEDVAAELNASASLKAQAQEFAGNYAVEEINDILKIDLDTLLKYNLIDGLSTWYVYKKNLPIMLADLQNEPYQKLFKPAVVDIIQMQLTGMPINMDKVVALNKQLEKESDDNLAKMNGLQIVWSFVDQLMDEKVIEKHTAPKSNLALMLGAWAGRQVEEKFSQAYNYRLVDELKRLHENRGEGDDDLYVNLPQLAKQMRDWENATPAQRKKMKKPDRVHVESWKVISPQTKRYIEEVWGKGNFYVRKDQINTVLGYRDPSVIDLWTGNTRVPQGMREGVQAITGLVMGDNAMRNMAAAEGAVQGVVSTAKDIIVVRSLVVPYMNTQANVVQLSTRGIPIKQQFRGYKAKLAEIEKFNNNRTKLIQLETRIQLAGTNANRVRILEAEYAKIEAENARFSVAPLIDAGAYKNISEGITEMDASFTSGRIGEWIENQTDKLPGGVQTVAKYGLLSKDTAVYKAANKAVQYGDFIAKSIYYDHLIDKGLSHDDAMKLVNEEFVNFSVLPGRTRTYLEGIGATWFLSFKIRIMKIAMNQIRENPARSMVLAATIADYGSPQADNLASVIVDDRLGYSLGWEMLFGGLRRRSREQSDKATQ